MTWVLLVLLVLTAVAAAYWRRQLARCDEMAAYFMRRAFNADAEVKHLAAREVELEHKLARLCAAVDSVLAAEGPLKGRNRLELARKEVERREDA